MFTIPLILAGILIVLMFVPFGKKKSGGESVASQLLAPVSHAVHHSKTPFQMTLEEDSHFLVEAYKEHALAEKRAEIAAKAAKYFAQSE